MTNISIKNVSIISKSGRQIIKDLNLNIGADAKLALIGSEGAGKSTILKVIAGIDMPDFIVTGEVITDNGKIGYYPQYMDSKWNKSRIVEFMLAATPDHLTIDWEKYSHAVVALAKVGLTKEILENENLFIKDLSGGENVRVRMAKLLLEEPNIILLDEPTNYLDIETLEWLESFIRNTEKCIVFITHDVQLIENCANKILYIQHIEHKNEAKYIYTGEDYNSFKESRNKEILAEEKEISFKKTETKRLKKLHSEMESKSSSKLKKSLKEAEGISEKNKAMRASAKQDKNLTKIRDDISELSKRDDSLKREEAIQIEFPFSSKIPTGRKIASFFINKLVKGSKILSKEVHLNITGPEKIIIIGRNGAGKTTLLEHIASYFSNSTEIKFSYVPQDYSEVLTDVNKLAASYLDDLQQDKTLNRTILKRLGFEREEMEKPIAQLSGGQKTKLMLSRAMVSGANVLILDEPTTNLSPLSNPVLFESLSKFPGCIIAVSHDRKFISHVATKVYELKKSGLKLVD